MHPETKPELRRQLRIARQDHVAALGAARTACEQALAARVAPLLGDCAPVASYSVYGAEIDPCWIGVGIDLAFPRVTPLGLEFRAVPRAGLVPGHRGIAEPGATMPLVWPRALLVPLVAVTASGFRLGQGGGHYDRAIRALRQRGLLMAIGVAWDMQLIDDVPVEPWDEPLDWIATPTRLVECAAKR
jgi:5-formyltetrahydrofolate cyclo-ligase